MENHGHFCIADLRREVATSDGPIPVTAFLRQLEDRVAHFSPAWAYSRRFWEHVLTAIAYSGGLEEPLLNDPEYIVDNIAINGQIHELDEALRLRPEIEDEFGGDGNAWAEANGFPVVEGYVVESLGL